MTTRALSMRLPPADLAVIDRAARLRGRSRTDFVREVAVRAAEETVLEQTLLRLDPTAFAQFAAEVARPGRVVAPLVELFSKPAPWETPAATEPAKASRPRKRAERA